MRPLALISSRKFEALTGWKRLLPNKRSVSESTRALALASATRTLICTPTVFVLEPSLMPNKVTVIVCALLTPVRLTVISVVLFPVMLETVPLPDVTAALSNVTALGKTRTT